MNSDGLRILGGVPDDPRIEAAFKKVQDAGDAGMTEAIVKSPIAGLERYGVNLRPAFGLMNSAQLQFAMEKCKSIHPSFQALIYIFLLGAPKQTLWHAVDILDKKGFAEFMVIVDDWFETSGIPTTISAELSEAINETFSICAKLMPKEEQKGEGDDLKKNVPPGTS